MFKRAQANIRHWIKWYNAEKAATAYERFFATLTVRLVPVSSEPSSARTQSGLFWKLVLEYVVKSDIFCNRKMSNSSLAKEKLSLELTLFSDLSQEEQPSPTMFLKEISLELNQTKSFGDQRILPSRNFHQPKFCLDSKIFYPTFLQSSAEAPTDPSLAALSVALFFKELFAFAKAQLLLKLQHLSLLSQP